MSLKDIVPFNDINISSYKDIQDREKFIKKIKIDNTIEKEARKLFNSMNTEFVKQFIQKGFSSGECVKYIFCLIPYNKNLPLEYYISSSKKIFHYMTKLNIEYPMYSTEIVFCLTTTVSDPDDTSNQLTPELMHEYNELKYFLSSEIVLEKTFNIKTNNDIAKYMLFCSMFDSYILTYDQDLNTDIVYWSWYLNSNWKTCKIVAPSNIKDKFPENEINSFLDV